jgi:alpha-galactosidase
MTRFSILLWCSLFAVSASHAKLKVFVLAGQSNMQGAGQVEMKENSRNGGQGTLAYLVKNEKTAKKYAHLVNKKGEWITRQDVWIRYDDRQDGLRPGFGFRNTSIGPELGFGSVVGDAIEEPVLLIKTCWGGKNVMVDFRSPSGGIPPKALMERMLAGKKKREPDATMKDVEAQVGFYYREMVRLVNETLKDIKKYYPAYDGKGYELVGFGWHQGWNDGGSMDNVNAYEENLSNIIKDLRKEWNVPNLSVAIGVSGFGGRNQKVDRRLGIIAAQHAVAKRKEFKGTVVSVETRDFFRPSEVSPSRQGYHWNGNAETYYLIGEGMGQAMVKLLKE